MPRLFRSWPIIAALLAGTLLASAQPAAPDPCAGRGTKPDGTCRDRPPPRVAPQAPTHLEVRSDPPGAEVRDGDGSLLGATPLSLDLTRISPGTHQLTFRLLGHEEASIQATVVRGATRYARITLKPFPSITVRSQNTESTAGILYVSGRIIGPIPVFNLPLEPGQHHLRVEKENHHPWDKTIELSSGDAQQVIDVALVPEKGALVVGRPGTSDLRGVDVYLDPEPEGEPAPGWDPSRPSRSGVHLGKTPLKPTKVNAGRHVVVLRPEGLEPRSLVIQVPAGGSVEVAAEPPLLVAPPSDDDLDIDLRAAISSCERADDGGEGCVVAGHEAAKLRNPPDLKRAEELYARGCKSDNEHACYALGYLQLRRGAGADETFRKACMAGVEDACWARYLSLSQIPDPSNRSGDRSMFRRKEGTSVPEKHPFLAASSDRTLGGGGPLIAFGPYEGTPFYLESNGAIGIKLKGPLWFDCGGGFRLRLLRQRAHLTSSMSTKFYGGLGFDVGFGLRSTSSLSFRTALRMTTYLPSDSGGSIYAAIGYLVTKRRLVEAGVILDRLPLRAQEVDVFGETRTITQRSWRPVIALTLHWPF